MATNPPFDERLERLLRTAAGVFAEKGYHPTTMRDLARATRMSLAGMYHYVAGKDELLYLIQARCFGEVLAGADAALAGVAGPEARLRAFVHHHVTFFASHMSEMKVLAHEAESLKGEKRDEIVALKRRYVALLERLIRDLGVPAGHATTGSYALFGMMNWIYTWYRPDGRLAAEELAERFAALFLRGAPAGSSSSIAHGG